MKSIAFLLLFFSWQPHQEILYGVVSEVMDGNTIELFTDEHERYKIELFGVDCPEEGQPFGPEAKALLSKKLKGKSVQAVVECKNRWGIRQATIIREGDDDARVLLLSQGLAWAAEKNAPVDFITLCEKAKASRVGLWNEADPVPPWTYR